MIKTASLISALLLATSVAGHGAVTSYVIGGTTYPGYTGFSPASSPPTIQWQWPDYNPTMDPAQSKVRCNGGTSAALSASVAAGGTVTAKWSQWTHAEGSISVYLFRCSGAFSSCTGSGNGWFKIDEAGLVSGTMASGTWGSGLVQNTLQWTSTIPASLAPGNYLIRHELIAVHQSNAPQFYPECAQIVVTGSGTASPSGSYLVSIPGYASLSDPNVSFDIYSVAARSITTWDVPGPPVWPSGTTPPPPPSSSSPRPSSSSPRPSSSSRASSTSSRPPTSTSSASGPGQTLWGQCGGNGYTGPTTCAQGTCRFTNEWYSQCVP